jgi:hypothetical protein
MTCDGVVVAMRVETALGKSHGVSIFYFLSVWWDCDVIYWSKWSKLSKLSIKRGKIRGRRRARGGRDSTVRDLLLYEYGHVTIELDINDHVIL